MTPNLEKFAADLRNDRISRASLFWLRVFVQQAQGGVLRSDVWVEFGLLEGATIPGLDATDLTPRLARVQVCPPFRRARKWAPDGREDHHPGARCIVTFRRSRIPYRMWMMASVLTGGNNRCGLCLSYWLGY